MNDRRLRVFFCYSSEDKHIMERFYRRLINERWIDLWLDEDRILAGMNREVEIERAVETADVVIVCLSHNSVTTEGNSQRELKLVSSIALYKPEGAVFVIPLRLDKCPVPRSMRTLQTIDFSSPEDREQAYRRLVRSLEMQADMVNKRTGKTRVAHILSSSGPQTFDDETQDAETGRNVAVLEFGGFSFVQIPKGKFIMGSKASNPSAQENEIPQCPCTIPYDYWISRFPVSNEQFSEFAVSMKCISALPRDWREKLSCPIVNISWYDAAFYTRWLNEIFGKEIPGGTVLRLPTEAEWERASRGDIAGEWPWGGDDLDKLLEGEISSSIESVRRNGQKIKDEIESLRSTFNIANVGSFSPLTDSPFGVADMMGSVVEWTQSLFMPYPYDAYDGREDLETKGKRVVRGCFKYPAERVAVRSARRVGAPPERKAPVLGFRIVIAPPIGK